MILFSITVSFCCFFKSNDFSNVFEFVDPSTRIDRLGWKVNFCFFIFISLSFSRIRASIWSQVRFVWEDLRERGEQLPLLMNDYTLRLLLRCPCMGCFKHRSWLCGDISACLKNASKMLELRKSIFGDITGVFGFPCDLDLKSMWMFVGERLCIIKEEMFMLWPLLLQLLSTELESSSSMFWLFFGFSLVWSTLSSILCCILCRNNCWKCLQFGCRKPAFFDLLFYMDVAAFFSCKLVESIFDSVISGVFLFYPFAKLVNIVCNCYSS